MNVLAANILAEHARQCAEVRKPKVDVTKVMKVYFGKAHRCCCGCSGTYKVASAFRKEADEARGYPYDDEDVSDRTVKRIVKKINQAVEDSGDVCEKDGDFVSVNIGERMYTAYFVPQKKTT